MITASPLPAQPAPVATDSWQQQWRDALRDPRELLAELGLAPHQLQLPEALRQFPLRAPRAFVARMRRGDPRDPLLLQVLPVAEEDLDAHGFGIDAVGDMAARRAAGVLQKYHGRALLIATGSCAVHCRYCFRRHFPYAEQNASSGRWAEALDNLRANAGIREVILSGGDPLSLGNEKLGELFGALSQIPHLRTLRIHSRLPIVLPDRIDDGLLALLDKLPLRKVVVVHANHANELAADTAEAMISLRATGTTLLNQSVLLRGINDGVDALHDLSEALFDQGVLPYYLHQLDRVRGASHFEVDDRRARKLVDALRLTLPGYLLPSLVREQAGIGSKTPL